MSVAFLITALVVVLIPGTGVIYTVATGLGQGRLASAFAALGCTLGIVPHILASVLGLAALLHTSAVLYQGLKYAGAAYLLFLAWQTLRDKGPLSFEPAHGQRRLHKVALSGFLINILNPKLSIFFLAFLPQFTVHGAAGSLTQMLFLGGVFMVMTFVVFVIYGQFAVLVREKFLQSSSAMDWLRRSTALVLGSLGLRLAFAHE